ncbi:MAG: hypothetical protein NT170_01505 [Candidatus Moranbacteria bacterium]|nr:hypothetical protein [Candidatus Moranbacteria bacterium]
MSKKSNTSAVSVAEFAPAELQKLAHAGTKEAIGKIEKFIKTVKDPEKNAYAEMALEECEMFYYQPTNEKEEQEFLLCELIRERERRIEDLLMKVEEIKLDLEKSALEGKVHEKVLATHKNKQEEWKHNWMEDFYFAEKDELQKIKDEMDYKEAWATEAKKMITIPRYKNMPARYLEHFDFNFGDKFREDGDDCCDCDDGCDAEVPF